MLEHAVRFDRFVLEPRERRLLVDGRPAALGARAFDVLLWLVARAGSLVTKAELLDGVWTGLVVEEANLAVQVSGLRKVLGGELIATIPGRGYRFTGQAEPLAGAAVPAAAAAPPAPPVPNAPPVPGSALVGRAADLAALRAALARPGCVTLVGPAGVGKTTLARALMAGLGDAAVWVDLAPLTTPAQVPAALAHALGQPAPAPGDEARLAPVIGTRLVVLDNAEHLVDAVAALESALRMAAPALALLATCQLPLGVAGEQVLRLEPLALPRADGDTERDDGALQLFLDRVRSADHRFVATAASAPLLRAICRQLDGLPLALEMAAARVPALGLKGLHEALQARFSVLTRGVRTAAERHRTLHAALDWSHALLNADEQRLLRQLAVFSGGFTLDLALALAARADPSAERWAVVDTLAALVDRSLVAVDAGADALAPRYRLLETVRAYALERLQAAGDHERLRRGHAEVLLALFERAAAADAADAARNAALTEHDNVREAAAWARLHAPGLAVRLTARICSVCVFVPWRVDALGWLLDCAPLVDAAGVDAADRADWWHERARHQLISRRPAEALAAAQEARTQYGALGDRRGRFMAGVVMVRCGALPPVQLRAQCAELQDLHAAHPEWGPRLDAVLHGTLAVASAALGELERALVHRRAELATVRALGSQNNIDSAETNIASLLHNLGRHEEVLAHCDAVLARLQGRPSINAAYAMDSRCASLVALGRHDEVRASAPRMARLARDFQLPFLMLYWAQVLAAEGRHAAAAQVLGHIESAYAGYGTPVPHNLVESAADLERAGSAALGSAAWQRARQAGAGLDPDGVQALLHADPAAS